MACYDRGWAGVGWEIKGCGFGRYDLVQVDMCEREEKERNKTGCIRM